ncbi:MAG: two-component regulator propeller domain-containing protein [Clostridia bacterium]|jgi:signal transduction histidine kinase/ligand-binding sensor domain-containing protein|nr:two-component regulator propeller domain-containing protein [Clostridia bacterium]
MRFIKITGLRVISRQLAKAFLLLFIAAAGVAGTSPAQAVPAGSRGNPIETELAGALVNTMFQDSAGFLWFGAQTGLYRYNGYSLKQYGFHSEQTNDFMANFITAIAEDGEGSIWLGTFGGGLFKLNPQTEETVHFYHREGEPGLHDNFIRALTRDAAGRLWIGTRNRGLDVLDPVSGQFTHYEHQPGDPASISANTITALAWDKTGALWIGTGDGLNKFQPRTGSFLHFPAQGQAAAGGGDDYVESLYADRQGVLWVAAGDGGLSRFVPETGTFLEGAFPELESLRVNRIYEDVSGSLWIGTYGSGLRMLDQDSGKFTVPGYAFFQNTTAATYRILSLFADTSGNLWLGTEGNGIAKINTHLNFNFYRNKANEIRFSDEVILSIYKDRAGTVWLGTANGGVNRFEREAGRITYYQHDPRDGSSISSNTITSIYEDAQGIFWFGAIDGTLNRFEPVTEAFTHYDLADPVHTGGGDNGILQIYEGTEGGLWVCTANCGLIRFDRSAGSWRRFIPLPEDPQSISSNHVLSVAEDRNGLLWVGTAGSGLNKLVPATGVFTRYGLHAPGLALPILEYDVRSIVDDRDRLWLATNRGLAVLDKAGGRLELVEAEGQAAGIFIAGLLQDTGDNLWLSTTNGLVKYGGRSGVFKKYEFNGGLIRNQYIQGACFQSGDGEMFFGGTSGFHSFYPDKIKDNTHRPPVVLTDFKIFDMSVPLSQAGEVTLSYQDNFISFEFAALDYADPARNQYAYKLEGFDTEWHYSGTRNYINYTNLGGGDYLLHIKAANNDGLWNEQSIAVRLLVTPPFWQTGWFKILSFLIAAAAIRAVVLLRTRSIKRQNLRLERQVTEKTRALHLANAQLRQADALKSNFLALVSHEIRTPLSAMLGFTERIADRIEKIVLPNLDLQDPQIQIAAAKLDRDLEIVIAEGDRLAALVDNLLDIARIESGKTDRQDGILEMTGLIEQALSITRPLLEKKRLTVRVEMAAVLPKVSGDRDQLLQVLINLLSNAVKFTKEGYIKICTQSLRNEILVSIEDTGAGIDAKHLPLVFDRFYKTTPEAEKETGQKQWGLGLYICKQIIEKHGGKIWVESKPNAGSIFYFTLPYGD